MTKETEIKMVELSNSAKNHTLEYAMVELSAFGASVYEGLSDDERKIALEREAPLYREFRIGRSAAHKYFTKLNNDNKAKCTCDIRDIRAKFLKCMFTMPEEFVVNFLEFIKSEPLSAIRYKGITIEDLLGLKCKNIDGDFLDVVMTIKECIEKNIDDVRTHYIERLRKSGNERNIPINKTPKKYDCIENYLDLCFLLVPHGPWFMFKDYLRNGKYKDPRLTEKLLNKNKIINACALRNVVAVDCSGTKVDFDRFNTQEFQNRYKYGFGVVGNIIPDDLLVNFKEYAMGDSLSTVVYKGTTIKNLIKGDKHHYKCDLYDVVKYICMADECDDEYIDSYALRYRFG